MEMKRDEVRIDEPHRRFRPAFTEPGRFAGSAPPCQRTSGFFSWGRLPVCRLLDGLEAGASTCAPVIVGDHLCWVDGTLQCLSLAELAFPAPYHRPSRYVGNLGGFPLLQKKDLRRMFAWHYPMVRRAGLKSRGRRPKPLSQSTLLTHKTRRSVNGAYHTAFTLHHPA